MKNRENLPCFSRIRREHQECQVHIIQRVILLQQYHLHSKEAERHKEIERKAYALCPASLWPSEQEPQQGGPSSDM